MTDKAIRTRGNSIAGMGKVTLVKGGTFATITTDSGFQLRVPLSPFSFLENGEIVPWALTVFQTTLEDASPKGGLILPPKLEIN